MKSKAKRFFVGVVAPFRGGMFLLRNPGLLLLALVPVLIVVLLLLAGLFWGWGFIAQGVTTFLPQVVGDPTSVWFYLSVVVGYVVFSLFLFIAVLLVANAIASPFNGLLAELILKKTGTIADRPFELKRMIGNLLRMLAISVARTIIFLGIGAVLLVLGFVPLLQLIAWFLGSLLVVLDCADFSLESLERGFRERFAIYRVRFLEFSGFAIGLGLTLVIPGLNFVMLPSSVAGCALLFAEFEKEKNEQNIARGSLRPT